MAYMATGWEGRRGSGDGGQRAAAVYRGGSVGLRLVSVQVGLDDNNSMIFRSSLARAVPGCGRRVVCTLVVPCPIQCGPGTVGARKSSSTTQVLARVQQQLANVVGIGTPAAAYASAFHSSYAGAVPVVQVPEPDSELSTTGS